MGSTNTLRIKLQLPSVDTTQIALVTVDSVCAKALSALDSLIHATNPDAPTNIPARNLYVVSFGGYSAVVDPGTSMGEWLPLFFFDAAWVYVSVLVGWG
jgi:hypothetical protein